MAVISINLDDKASAGLKQLTDELAKVDEATTSLTESSAELSAEQERQITVIHEHRAGLTTVGVAMAKVVEQGLRLTAIYSDHYIQVAKVAAIQQAYQSTMNELSERLAFHAARWGAIQASSGTAISGIVRGLAGAGTVLAGVTAGFSAWEAVMERTGKRADELGNVTTNMDRIRAAAGGLASDLKEPFVILADNAKQFVAQLNPLPAIWQEIDASATRYADQLVININILRDTVKGTRELEEATARLEKQREKEAPGFEAIRQANQILAGQEANRLRQNEIGSIKTIEGIEAEIRKVREKAAQVAQAGVDEQKAAELTKGLVAEINALQQQRTAIEAQEIAKRQEGIKAFEDWERQLLQSRERQQIDTMRRIADESEKELDKIRQQREQEARQEQDAEDALLRSRETLRQLALMDEARRKQAEVQAAQQAAQKTIEIEQAKQQQLKALRGEALEKAGVKGQDLLKLANPNDVRKTLQDQAREAARQKAAADNQGLFREAQFDSGGEARKKYDRLLQQAQDEAGRQAARDFNKGKTDPAQLAQAQAQAANKQLGALQASGKLSDTSVKAMQELIQTTATEQARTDALQRQVDQMVKDAASLRSNSQQQLQRQKAQANAL
ncbi:MAG: hypothetical protein JSS49_27505 [Planctomycetes bacterium]|nr:hypothetical protein [Planctomycetota bacterium]